ncbi:MAG: hypothetical protein U5R48_05695 [Gammaproteobacteria bacterium]|nr:hypothetical protein [Gammaproteobacteria bacterium]
MKIMFKRITAIAVFLLLPFAAQADIAGDIEAGVPADQVVANALAEGMSIGEIMLEIAQQVGSDNVAMFQAAAAQRLRSVDRRRCKRSGRGRRREQRDGGSRHGELVRHQRRQRLRLEPRELCVLQPGRRLPVRAGAGTGGRPGAGGAGSGGGGGQNVEDALCEAAGSEPGCLDAA